MLIISGMLNKGGGFRAAADEEAARRELDDLNRQKGEVIRKWDALGSRYGVQDAEEVRQKIAELEGVESQMEDFDDQNNDLEAQMADLFADFPAINENDYDSF